jgi:hypothetical protein
MRVELQCDGNNDPITDGSYANTAVLVYTTIGDETDSEGYDHHCRGQNSSVMGGYNVAVIGLQ